MCARDCALVLVNFNTGIYQVRLARLTLLGIFLAQSCASMCTSISAGSLEKIGGAPGNGPGTPRRTRQIPGAQATASSATGGWPLAQFVLYSISTYWQEGPLDSRQIAMWTFHPYIHWNQNVIKLNIKIIHNLSATLPWIYHVGISCDLNIKNIAQ